ncbi:hypothetical protein HMPREF1508_1366 [Shuttleworthella sp. MSX8B]|nr:hypothetical protein HMPREF1508_1366 [Shuttleworthia sp. MSX8B]
MHTNLMHDAGKPALLSHFLFYIAIEYSQNLYSVVHNYGIPAARAFHSKTAS